MPTRKPADQSAAVYRIHPAAFWISLFVGLLLQVSLPLKIPLARLFDFPLILTVYFALVRRSKVFGIALGTGLGLVQDALSHGLIGMFGIAKGLVGYLAASASLKFDMEQLGARYVLTGVLVAVHRLLVVGLQNILFESAPPFVPLDLASAVIVNVALALICYQVLDRFRQPA
ncbi:MAG TPA: rod shape-determining protein MreD [Terriglobia bacterium]|nr:rod shape-determining protein MreD [Terriglobia bacterium]